MKYECQGTDHGGKDEGVVPVRRDQAIFWTCWWLGYIVMNIDGYKWLLP